MAGLKTLITKFETLIERKLPRVHAHQHLIGLPVTFRACAWFLSLFFGCLKDAHLLRTWDLIFYHYHHNDKSQPHPTVSQQSQPAPPAPCNAKHAEAVLSCIGLALIKTVEERLCKCTNSTDLGMVIQELGTDLAMPEEDFFELALGGVCSLWEAAVAESVASRSQHSGPGSGKKRRADGENVSMTPQPHKKSVFGSRKSPRTTGTFWSRRKYPNKENSEAAAEPNKVADTPAKVPRRSFFSSPPPFRIRN
jgi:hypothetical protein